MSFSLDVKIAKGEGLRFSCVCVCIVIFAGALVFLLFSAKLHAQVTNYVPRVIVKFNNDQIDPQIPNAADQFLTRLKAQAMWMQLVARFPGIRIEKLITALTQKELLSLRDEAFRRNPTYRQYAPNFLTYFVIPCPPTVDPQAVARTFSSSPWKSIVERAYVEGKPSDAFPSVKNPDLNPAWARPDTEFLRAAPAGIDAQSAWNILGGDGGTGTLKFVDIESDWDLGHPDLPPANGNNIPLIYGVRRPYTNSVGVTSTDHGTGVLGIVVGANNCTLGLGITPNLTTTMVASYWQFDPNGSPPWTPDRANAILAAIAHVNEGDVVLLEMQIDQDGLQNLPVEYDEDLFHHIQLGTQSGRVIVEAAGNGGHDLDNLPIHVPWLVRASGNNDSGAILISAATSDLPHRPVTVVGVPQQRVHNYGSRIDSYAWGENIYTTKSGGSIQTFGGTSGASAIIAGAALSVQGMAAAKPGGSRLTPLQMRNILSDPSLVHNPINPFANTVSKSGVAIDKIGVMPNLKTIIGRLGIIVRPPAAVDHVPPAAIDVVPPAAPPCLTIR